MRIRSVKPEFFKDRVTGRMPADLKLLYVGLWCFADDSGRFEWEPDLIRAELYPYDREADVEGMLERLREQGRVVQYVVDGQVYGSIPSFERHQHPDKPKASKLPEPTEENVRRGNVPDSSPTPPRQVSAGYGEDTERRGYGSSASPPAPPTVAKPAESVPSKAPTLVASEPPQPSRHRDWAAMLSRVFAETRGGKYDFRPVDGKKLAELLKRLPEATLDDAEQRWRRALTLGGKWPGCATVAHFADRWNDLAGLPSQQRGMAPVSSDFTKTLEDL